MKVEIEQQMGWVGLKTNREDQQDRRSGNSPGVTTLYIFSQPTFFKLGWNWTAIYSSRVEFGYYQIRERKKRDKRVMEEGGFSSRMILKGGNFLLLENWSDYGRLAFCSALHSKVVISKLLLHPHSTDCVKAQNWMQMLESRYPLILLTFWVVFSPISNWSKRREKIQCKVQRNICIWTRAYKNISAMWTCQSG